jgi:hypothetical protein
MSLGQRGPNSGSTLSSALKRAYSEADLLLPARPIRGSSASVSAVCFIFGSDLLHFVNILAGSLKVHGLFACAERMLDRKDASGSWRPRPSEGSTGTRFPHMPQDGEFSTKAVSVDSVIRRNRPAPVPALPAA